MSVAATKAALKSIKAHIEKKDHEAALYESTELLKRLKDQDPAAVQALIYRGLTLTHLEKRDEAEKASCGGICGQTAHKHVHQAYLHAYRLDPTNKFVLVGLRRLYEKGEQWEKLDRFLEILVQAAYDGRVLPTDTVDLTLICGDGESCAGALQDLSGLRQKHGPIDKVYRALELLIPSSPLAPLLQPLPPPSGSYTPFPTPIYPPPSLAVLPSLPSPLPHVLHLLGSLSILLNLLIRSEASINQETEAKVKAARGRLGGPPEKEVRRIAEADILGGPMGVEMVDLLREIASHPGVEESVRRQVEIREFGFWRRLVGVLPPQEATDTATKAPKKVMAETIVAVANESLPEPPLFTAGMRPRPSKTDALTRANGLAEGFVLLGVGDGGAPPASTKAIGRQIDAAAIKAEDGWCWVIDGRDEGSLLYDLDLLHSFAKTFPVSPLTDFIDDYCRWFKLPLPQPDEEAVPSDAVTEIGDTKSAKVSNKKRYGRNKPGMNAKERRKARRVAAQEGGLPTEVDQEERDELVSSLTKLLDKLPRSIFAHRVVARISIEEEDWANAISFTEKGRTLVKELEAERGISLPHVKASLDTALGVACVPYYAPKHHTRASRLLDGVLKKDPTNGEARFARAQILQYAGKWSEARKNFQILLDDRGDEKIMVSAEEEVGWCLVNEGKLVEGRELLEQIVEVRDARKEQEGRDDEAFARARAWWRLGRTEWVIGDNESRQHAENWFMASIRAMPTYAPAYSSLGICYSEASPPDEDRALKCFQKAFELDATEADAARRLAIGCANDDEWASVRTIAMRVMQGEGGLDGVAGGEVMNAKGRFAPKNGWAWKALGSTEMHYRNYARAAQAYQIAIRADPEDATTWVLLGESYAKSGRQMAALKTLQHALRIDPKAWMAYYHIGDVQTQLGAFEMSIEAYETIAAMTDVREVGVTAATAQAMLALGIQAAAGGFRERSRRAFHGALDLAARVLQAAEGHRPWAWKIIGDAAFELSSQESTIEVAESSARILEPILQLLVKDDSDRRSVVEGLGHAANLLQTAVDLDHTLKAAVFAYAYRAHLLKNETRVADPALYDLVSAIHALALRYEDGPRRQASLKAAISAIRLALERDAGDERLWNALGVICADAGPQVAQHAFVVSLELYGKDPIGWGNLGYLYLRLNDRDLANQCFLKAQIMDPDYAPAWLGQGFLAERNGDREHAVALFAHSVTLSAGSLLESDLALAATTFERFLQPGSLVDVTQLHDPAFALRHYCHQRPRDSAAAHLFALICERLGLAEEAAESLERAAHLLEEEFERTESIEIEERYSMALCNLGRAELATGQYEKALEAFTNCWELVIGSQEAFALGLRVQCKLGQGVALSWLDRIEESLEAFEAALGEAEGTNDAGLKEEVAVLLSRTLWGLGGEDAKETAKTHLMECLEHETPSISVISTLAAMALIGHDADLVDASLSELKALSLERKTREDQIGSVELVLSAQALNLGQKEEARATLEAAVHSHPSDLSRRNRLATMLVQHGRSDEALGVLDSAALGGDVVVMAERWRLRGMAQGALGGQEGKGSLQKAVRLRPWNDDGWRALAGMNDCRR